MKNGTPPNSPEAQKYTFHKVSTGIPGLDSLMYGGMDLSDPFTVIFVKSDLDTERAMFGVQLIYGLAQSIMCIIPKEDAAAYYPEFISTVHDPGYINDALLDIIISASITILRNRRLSSGIMYSSTFSKVFFKLDNVVCGNFAPSLYDYRPENIQTDIDDYICSEAVYYGNGTNALHMRTKETTADTMNILFERRHDSINEYFGIEDRGTAIPPERLEAMDCLSEYVGFRYMPMYVSRVGGIDDVYDRITGSNLLVVDAPDICTDPEGLKKLADTICRARKELKRQKEEQEKAKRPIRHHVLIVTLPTGDSTPLADYLADMVITMKPAVIQDYRIERLSIDKSKRQTTTQGWHQYKYRDYGFEVYPSLHRIFQVRRYLQRAMVYTHSDVVTDTYQQYLLRLEPENADNALNDYMAVKDRITDAYVDALYPDRHTLDYRTVELMSRILLYDPDARPRANNTATFIQNHIQKTQEGVTAIIGSGNTFKRFLVTGGVFSSSIHKEHTLILMLNKDEHMIRRRLACPARGRRSRDHRECRECYSYIHFMNMMMGCITPEEFLYYLQLQLDTPFRDGKRIKRIVIDDLQILDYCFPLLKNNPLFISALAILCRERDITLHILCDEDSDSVQALRAIADNTIHTDRDSDGKLRIHVERYAGYHNSPSKIYCGRIGVVSELFECFDRKGPVYQINSGAVEEKNMNSYLDYGQRRKKQ